jgi:LacI family transcriptional regulator/LacI family purine nucleotide synthesis repressor
MNPSIHDDRTVTLKDIAKRAGVSVMAVSTVLRGKTGTVRVSEETREKILRVAQEMRYRPHAVARALRQRRTDTIGFYSGHGYVDVRSPFHSVIIGGLQEGCDLHRKNLLLYGTLTGSSPNEIYDHFADGRIDGLVIIASARDPLVSLLRDSSLPTVAIVDSIPGLPSVVADEAEGARLIVDRLAERGHRRVLYCYDPDADERLDSAHRRRVAFEEQCSLHAVAIEYWQVEDAPDRRDSILVQWKQRRCEESATAVVCRHDVAAYKFLRHCEVESIAVPGDQAVVG